MIFVLQHALLEGEAETVRSSISNAAEHVRSFAEEVTEWSRKLCHVIQQIEGGYQPTQDTAGHQRTVQVRHPPSDAGYQPTQDTDGHQKTVQVRHPPSDAGYQPTQATNGHQRTVQVRHPRSDAGYQPTQATNGHQRTVQVKHTPNGAGYRLYITFKTYAELILKQFMTTFSF